MLRPSPRLSSMSCPDSLIFSCLGRTMAYQWTHTMVMVTMMTLKMIPNWAGVFRQSQALLAHHGPSSLRVSYLVIAATCLTMGRSGDMVFDLVRCA